MSATEDLKKSVREFLLAGPLRGEVAANVPDDLKLRTSGILDSIATVALVGFVEKQFGIELEAHETGVEQFDSIADVAALIERKLSQAKKPKKGS
jgi:acyl carrier protein